MSRSFGIGTRSRIMSLAYVLVGEPVPTSPEHALAMPKEKFRIRGSQRRGLVRVMLVSLALGITPASAQTSQPPFAPKAIQLIIGFGPGGNYDLWARTLSRHYGKHLPGK